MRSMSCQGWFILSLSLWLADGSLLVISSHCLPSVYVCVQIPSSCKITGHALLAG